MNVNLFLIGAVTLGLGLTACNKSDNPFPDQEKGTTYAGMYVSVMTKVTSKAVNDSQEDYEGRSEEGTLTHLNLLGTRGSHVWEYSASEAAGKFWPVTSSPGTYKVSPWKTGSGQQTMALVFNKGGLTPDVALAEAATYGGAGSESDNIKALSTDGKFVMTSASASKTILPDVTESQAESGSGETDNVFSFDVERVVAQGMVIKDDNLQENTADGKGKVKLTNLTYAAVNGAVKTYIFGNHAGSRTLDVTTQKYTGFKSAIDDYTEFANAKDPAGVKDYLIRLGNLLPAGTTPGTNEDLGNYKAVDVEANLAAAKAKRGVYFMENSVNDAELTSVNKDYGFYRLAYAKVYATYTPNLVYYWDNASQSLKTEAGTEGMTFYVGEQDGLVYKDKESAKHSPTHTAQTKAYTYTNGKCAYRVLWNRQEQNKSVVNADTRRNNTYVLKIVAFQGVGMPWDSSDPGDPNLPKPTDPDEPTNPDNPDIEKAETYMRVEGKVLKWNLVSREVVLE